MKTLLRKAILAIFLLLFCTTFVNAEVYYVDTDTYGTLVAVSKSDGTTVWESDYYPFGELYRNINNQKPNNRGLIGKEKDQETGLTYFGARYHDEALGRFGSVDPIGPVDPWTSQTDYAYLTNPQRLNRYVYGMNNPYRYIDPDGRSPSPAEIPESVAKQISDLDFAPPALISKDQFIAFTAALVLTRNPVLAVEAGFGVSKSTSNPTGFKGSKGFELNNAPFQKTRNTPTTINNRNFSGHALDQMQNRGLTPSVVENTLQTGTKFPTKPGTTGYYDSVNNVRVITNSDTGTIVTVIRGAP